VDNYSDSFNESSEALRTKAAADDFADLQDAMANRNVGRQRRHLHGEEIDPLTGKTKAEQKIQRTLEWLLLNDAVYKQAHAELITALHEGQQETQLALDRVAEALAIERTAMNDLLSSAAKLPDGRTVFRDKNGEVRDEDGNIVPDELAATIQWRGDEPSYEDYLVQRDRISALEAAENELRGTETELGEIHNNATTNDDPLTTDEIDAAKERTDALRERVKNIDAGIQNRMPSGAQIQAGAETQDTTPRTQAVIPRVKIGD